jgi:SAM-dependent methyltransferase
VRFDTGPVRRAYEVAVDQYAEQFGDDLVTNDFDRAVIDDATAGLQPGAIVIDLGCGPGQVAGYLSERGTQTVGLDLTPAMLAVARRRNPALPLVRGDLFALPVRSASVDGVVAWYSLHNVPRVVVPAALSELRRVLRPGGTLLIATHGGRGQDLIEQTWMGRPEAVVITYYEPEELEGLLVFEGFRVGTVRQRPPRRHEHQVAKIFVVATLAREAPMM